VIELSSDVTVEDLLNQLRSPDLNLSVGINAAATGWPFPVASAAPIFRSARTTGRRHVIGNPTLTGNTLLSKLNYGDGVPVNGGQPLTTLAATGRCQH